MSFSEFHFLNIWQIAQLLTINTPLQKIMPSLLGDAGSLVGRTFRSMPLNELS